jgi:hypothetical protein
MPVILANQKSEIRKIGFETSAGQIYQNKKPSQKRTGRMAQVIRTPA